MKRIQKYSIVLFFVLGALSSLQAQTVSIIFQVNMSQQISIGQFDPATEFVDIAGTFNGWGSTPLIRLFDNDGDDIYEISISGFSPGSNIEYKYRFNGTWDGIHEFPGGGNNRVYTVLGDVNIVYVWFNDEVATTGPPVADFTVNTQTLFEDGQVYLKNLSAGAIDTWEWTFEGGSPEISDLKDPIIFYSTAGVYDVTLIVSNASESDTLTLLDFIEVKVRDTSELSWWNNAVFYEIFVRSFYDSDGNGIGDFKGIIEKLDYLNDGDPDTDSDLGITGIWLMPISQSPSYHGYDVTDYKSIESDYGSMDDFKLFLDEAHQRGIRVIIDFVMNHSSSQHPWFQQATQNVPEFRNYYRWSTSNPGTLGPWGQQVWHSNSGGNYYGLFWGGMPDLNYENNAMKDSMFAAADFWLKDIGVDGFRLDAVKYIFEEGEQLQDTESTFQFWGEFNQQMKQSNPDAFSVGEAWTNTETILKYVTQDRLDYCFEFDLAYATLHAVNTGDATGLAAQMQKVYNNYPHLQYGTFLTNHDQNRVMNVVQSDEGKAKAAAALYLTMPGIPYLYYGEEIGMVGVKPDEYIRTPMQWSSASNAGFTSGSPWIRVNGDYSTKNVSAQQADPTSLLNWYKQLISIRNHADALRLGDYIGLESSSTSVMAFLRRDAGQSILVLVNTGPDAQNDLRVTFPGSMLEPRLYAIHNFLPPNEQQWINISSLGETEALAIDGYGVKIYLLADALVSLKPDDKAILPDFQLHQNFPNPFNPSTTIQFSLAKPSFVKLQIFDLKGNELSVLVSGQKQAGKHSIQLNAEAFASGTYIYRLQIGNSSQTKKLVILK